MHVYFKQRDGARQVLNCHELQIAGRQLLLCARRCRMAASCPCIDISNAALFCVTFEHVCTFSHISIYCGCSSFQRDETLSCDVILFTASPRRGQETKEIPVFLDRSFLPDGYIPGTPTDLDLVVRYSDRQCACCCSWFDFDVCKKHHCQDTLVLFKTRAQLIVVKQKRMQFHVWLDRRRSF